MKNSVEDLLFEFLINEAAESAGVSGGDLAKEELKRETPLFTTDLFLITASLLELSGAYSYFDPDSGASRDFSPEGKFTLPPIERQKAIDIAKAWNPDKSTPDGLKKAWDEFIELSFGCPIRMNIRKHGIPKWWNVCFFLMVVADEAAEGLGSPIKTGDSVQKRIIHFSTFFKNIPTDDISKAPKKFHISGGSDCSFTKINSKNFRNVFPKEKISITGCSHKNFSKNLTLLPSAGNVRCHWHLPSYELLDDDDDPIDILIIPFPFEVTAKAFRPKATHKAKDSGDGGIAQKTRSNWANFEIDQNWLNRKIDRFETVQELASSLLKSAKQDVNTVNGIIFPEYSLTYEVFKDICDELKKIEPNLEFIIAGTSTNCDGDSGNTVMTSVWHNIHSPENSDKIVSSALISSRKKHHRWMLSKDQIESYALTSSLDPRINWWETLEIGQRELHFYPFRKSSLFSSLICEDLARHDPCHEVLRSIGPNLIFALLMDGPQLKSRWSARYAASLSDDPGSSVLTVTSYALIDRANKIGRFEGNDTVALFSSPNGQTELKLPYSKGARGILINLISEKQFGQQTIDGREKGGRYWHLSSSQPIFPTK